MFILMYRHPTKFLYFFFWKTRIFFYFLDQWFNERFWIICHNLEKSYLKFYLKLLAFRGIFKDSSNSLTSLIANWRSFLLLLETLSVSPLMLTLIFFIWSLIFLLIFFAISCLIPCFNKIVCFTLLPLTISISP